MSQLLHSLLVPSVSHVTFHASAAQETHENFSCRCLLASSSSNSKVVPLLLDSSTAWLTLLPDGVSVLQAAQEPSTKSPMQWALYNLLQHNCQQQQQQLISKDKIHQLMPVCSSGTVALGTSSAVATRINCSRSSRSVHIPAAGAAAAAGITSWQLSFQQHLPVCNGLQQLPATVSCCCLLALHPSAAAAAASADTSQQWQQLLAAAGCRSNTSYINTLQTLAAAATATIIGCSSRSSSRTEPVQAGAACNEGTDSNSHCCCCTTAFCTEQLLQSLAGMASLRLRGSSSSRISRDQQSQPICSGWLPMECATGMFVVGTATGRVWVCSGWHAVVGSSGSKQQQQQGMQVHCTSRPALLLDLQQHVVAVLAASSLLIAIGQLGRVMVVLPTHHQHQQQQQQQHQQQEAAKYCMFLHHQLNFQVADAWLLHRPDSSSSGGGGGGGSGGGRGSSLLLLLLSTSGSMYVALISSSSHHHHHSQAQQQQLNQSQPAADLFPLHPVKVQLAAPVHKVFVRQRNDTGKVCLAAPPAAGTSSSGGGGSGSSTVIVQLSQGWQLLELHHSALWAMAEAACSTTSTQNNRTTTAAAAATATRQQLHDVMTALDLLSLARQQLREAVQQQERHLAAVNYDVAGMFTTQQLDRQQQSVQHPEAQQQQQAAPPAPLGLVAPSRLQQAARAGLTSNHCHPACMMMTHPLCAVSLQGLWPAPAAAGSGRGSSSSRTHSCGSLHLAVSVQLTWPSNEDSSSSSSNGSSKLGSGWQLLISFLPESAHTSSWQATVTMLPCGSKQGGSGGGSNSRTGNLEDPGSSQAAAAASVLLPLPGSCCALREGGWLQVYAVKDACQKQFRLNQQQQQNEQQVLLPAVALLAQKYVSTLQLGQLLEANPAAAAAAAATAMSAPIGRLHSPPLPAATDATAAAAGQAAAYSSSGAAVNCMLHLAAAHTSVGNPADPPQQHCNQRWPYDSRVLPHKRRKTAASHTTDSAPVPDTYAGYGQGDVQPQQQQVSAQPFGTALASWLSTLLLPPPENAIANYGSGSSSGSSGSSTATALAPLPVLSGKQHNVAVLQGRVRVLLTGSAGQAWVTWSSKPVLLPQKQHERRAEVRELAAAAAGAAVARLPVDVAIQASSATGVALIHRAMMLALLQQLLPDPMTATAPAAASSTDGCSTASSMEKRAAWQLATGQQQMQLALRRLRQVQRQLMQLRDVEDQVQRFRDGAAGPARAGGSLLGNVAGRVAKDYIAAAGSAAATAGSGGVGTGYPGAGKFQQQPRRVEAPAMMLGPDVLLGLVQAMGKWQSGLQVAYGRMLLAMADAACLVRFE